MEKYFGERLPDLVASCFVIDEQDATKSGGSLWGLVNRLGDHLRHFHRKSDEYRTSALFGWTGCHAQSLGRFQIAVEISFISPLFQIISGRKVRTNALTTKFKTSGIF